jgi:hypothetical protein
MVRNFVSAVVVRNALPLQKLTDTLHRIAVGTVNLAVFLQSWG